MTTSQPDPTAAIKARRRWFQFSLKSLMVLVVVVSLPVAWLAHRLDQKRRERAVVEKLSDLGQPMGWVYYAHQLDEENRDLTDNEPPGPEWLRQLLGNDFFSDLVGVGIMSTGGDDTLDDGERRKLDEVLESLGGLPWLRDLELQNLPLGDAGLNHLERLTSLTGLS